MITLIPTQHTTISRNMVQYTIALLKTIHTSAAWARGFKGAEGYLLDLPWAYDAQTAMITIASKSAPNILRHASPDQCDCPARVVCVHRAAALICSTLAGAGMWVLAPLPLAECVAAVDAGKVEVLEYGDDDAPEFGLYFEERDPEPILELDEQELGADQRTQAAATRVAPTCPTCKGKMIDTIERGRSVWACEDKYCRGRLPGPLGF